MRKLLGISGYAQSGKDTLAQFLIEDHGFTRIAFADLLKQVIYTLNPIIDPIVGFRVNDVVDDYGWEYAKKNVPELRRLLQRMGTEAGRDLLGENLWVDAAFQHIATDGSYCITDMRFPNEAKKIVDNQGKTVRINRAGVGPVNDHWGEVALDDWQFDFVISNDEDLDYLRGMADEIVNQGWDNENL